MENKDKLDKLLSLPVSIVIAALVLAGAWAYDSRLKSSGGLVKAGIEENILPSQGTELPVVWGDLGKKLVETGAIDAEKFKGLYERRGQFGEEYEKLLLASGNGKIRITAENAPYWLNLLWALGLSNSNPVLTDAKEMNNPKYGGAGNFASTGGWTLAAGDAMEHYSRHIFFELTPEQQGLVEKVSRGIYRPCCGNSTHFPDCNHGMAMLGLLELMASQGVSESEMWRAALAVNSYWFPDTYQTIAQYMKNKGVEWQDVNPQEILGFNYSSASGYSKISAQVGPHDQGGGGGGCGVDSGPAPARPAQQPSCGI